MRGARLLQLTVLLTFLLALPLLAQAPTDNVLTNADIVKMMKAGLPESIILREIQMSNTDFATSPAALIELKTGRVGEDSGRGPRQPNGHKPARARTVGDTARCRTSSGAGPSPSALP